MPTCPKCRHYFRVPLDEDDGQNPCPWCGYDEHEDDHSEGDGADDPSILQD